MQKSLFLVIAVTVGLSACVQRTPVSVVKAQEDTTARSSVARVEPVAVQTPPNATAVCRDGSFSFASDDSKCIGKGGVKTLISRYHSE